MINSRMRRPSLVVDGTQIAAWPTGLAKYKMPFFILYVGYWVIFSITFLKVVSSLYPSRITESMVSSPRSILSA